MLGVLLSASAVGSMAASLIVGHIRQAAPPGYLFLPGGHPGLCRAVHIRPAVTAQCGGTGVPGGIGSLRVWHRSLLRHLLHDGPATCAGGRSLGRVSSIDWIGSLAFEPIGLAVIGILTDRLGPSPVFLVAGGVNAILALVGMLAVRGIRELD